MNQLLDVTVLISRVEYGDENEPYTTTQVWTGDLDSNDEKEFLNEASKMLVHGLDQCVSVHNVNSSTKKEG